MTPRRVYVDGRMLAGEGTGVATYARTLVKALETKDRFGGLLRARGTRGSTGRFVHAIAAPAVRLQADGRDLVGRDIFRIAQQRFSLTGRISRLRVAGPPAIMHWTYPLPLAIEGWVNLYTIHDVIPLLRPDLSPIDPRRHRRLLDAVGAAADRILTVTQAARSDILASLGWPADRVVDCGQAVEAALADPAPEGLRSRGYFLFCGRIEKRKNLERLIRAHRASECGLPLLIAGPVAEGGDAILAGLGGASDARYLGYVGRDTLARLRAHARALLMPSLYEGFGLPVVEAMASRTPVLVSRDRALVEVADDAAVIIDATDETGLATAIRRLAEDDRYCGELATAGLIRADHFSLGRWAERLDAVYAAF